MSETPSIRPDVVDKIPEETKPRGFRLIELLVIIAIIAIVIAFLMPAIRSATEPARRTQCINHLKNLTLALHNYHSKYGVFPPAYTVDGDGKPLHSWRTLILPYLDQQEVYEMIDFTKAWDDPANDAAWKHAIEKGAPYFRCYSSNVIPMQTNYLAVVTHNSCLRPGQSVTIHDATDGLENTLLLIEVDNAHAVNWMSPWDADEQTLLELGGRFSPPHEGVILGAFTDGRVHRLDVNLTADVRRAMISIDGNERVPADLHEE